MRHGRRIGWEPCPHASGIKALVWYDERVAEDVSREPSLKEAKLIRLRQPFKTAMVLKYFDNSFAKF